MSVREVKRGGGLVVCMYLEEGESASACSVHVGEEDASVEDEVLDEIVILGVGVVDYPGIAHHCHTGQARLGECSGCVDRRGGRGVVGHEYLL